MKMATGEVVDDESLGGADMHSKISGVSDYLAVNEYAAIKKAREVIFNLNWKKVHLFFWLPVFLPLLTLTLSPSLTTANTITPPILWRDRRAYI